MKRKLLILALFLLVVSHSNLAFASDITDDYFDIAVQYFNEHNYVKALEYLDYVLQIEPGNLQASTLRNKIVPPQKPQPDASDAIIEQKVINTSQTNTQTNTVNVSDEKSSNISQDSNSYISKGLECYQKKDYAAAIDYFYKAENLDPKNAQIYNNLGLSYLAQKDTQLAIKYFKMANFKKRNYTEPLINLALVYKQLGDNFKQFYYLQLAVGSNPNDYRAYYQLGNYYRDQGKYSDAINKYKKSIKINPKFADVYLDLANAFFAYESYNYCLQAINQYREFYPNSDYALALAAKADFELQNYDEAKNYIKQAISINNVNDYKLVLAKTEFYLENYQNALDILQPLLINSDVSEIYNYIGLCNLKLDDVQDAIISFKKAIDLDGLRPIYYYNLAQCYNAINDEEQYMNNYNTAIKINPVNYQDFIDLNNIYYEGSNTDMAINILNAGIKKFPNEKSLYVLKLKIYEGLADDLHYNETQDIIDKRFNNL